MAKGLAVQTGVSEFGSFYNYCANQASVPASVISALGGKRLPVPSASWLTSCTGAPRLERTYLKNKTDSDQGAHQLRSSTCVCSQVHRQLTSSHPYLPPGIMRTDTPHVHTRAEEGGTNKN